MAAFYRRFVSLFYSSVRPVRWDRFLRFRLLFRVHSEVEKIVYRMPEILFTAEIAFRGLDRCMPQQKLNLLKLPAAVVTQLRTGPPQVVRGDVF